MERDSISNEVRYVVNQKHVGPIFPTKLRDLRRTVFLNSGAEIQGAVFADSIQITGGHVSIDRAVFARNNMKITMDKPGFINFKSTVAVRKSVLIENQAKDNYIRIRGDLFVENAHLEKMIVYGNVYGKKLVLDDSAVLGGVFVEENLDVNRSLIGTFVGTEVTLNDQTTLWLTDGIARKALKLNGRVRGFTFALPKVFRSLLEDNVTELPGETIDLISEDVKILNKEIVDKYLEMEKEERAEEQFSFSKDLFSSGENLFYFGLEPRIYNTDNIQSSFTLNKKMHRILLDPSFSVEDTTFKKFDEAIFKYIRQESS